MLKMPVAAILFALAAPAAAQSPAAAPAADRQAPPPEFMEATQAFGQCIGTSIQGSQASATPEAAASAALASCAQKRSRMEQLFETWLSGSNMPDAQKAAAREKMKSKLAGAEGQIAEAIRRMRAAPAAAK